MIWKMDIRYLRPAIFIAAAVIAAISCKKDEETELLPSLNGSLTFSLPEYIASLDSEGEQVKFSVTPKGVSHPEGKPLGYYWKLTPPTDNEDTGNDTIYLSNGGYDPTGKTELVFKDSLYTCTIVCGAFADGYYSTTGTRYATIVKGGINGTITLAGFGGPYINQDQTNDEYTVIGNYRWMRRNLPPKDGYGLSFKSCDAMADVYGGYFTYAEYEKAENDGKRLCPEGWDLPDDAAWRDLGAALSAEESEEPGELSAISGIAGKMMVNARFNADVKHPEDKDEEYIMWEYWPDVEITNSSFLSVIPTGYASSMSRQFSGAYEPLRDRMHYAAFLTADEVMEEGNPTGQVYYRYIIENSPDLHIGKGDKNSFAASVRCVQKVN